MDAVAKNTFLGSLAIDEVYQYYDGPKLFSCSNNVGQGFLCFWLGEVDEPCFADEWLYVPISKTRLNKVKTGKIDLRDACLGAEDGYVWIVRVTTELTQTDTVKSREASSLEDDNLPVIGTALRIATPTIPEIEPIELYSLRSRNDIVDLSLSESTEYGSEVGIGGLGGALVTVQGVIDYMFANKAGYKSYKIPEHVIKKSKINAVGAFPSSFGVRLQLNYSQPDIFGENEMFAILTDFIRFVNLGKTPADLIEAFAGFSSFVVAKWLAFFTNLSKSKVAFKANWCRPNPESKPQFASITWEQAHAVAEVLQSSIEKFVDVITIDCTLDSISIPRRTFGLVDNKTGIRYEGKFAEDIKLGLKSDATKVPANYIAELATTQKIRQGTTKVLPMYTLNSLKEPSPKA